MIGFQEQRVDDLGFGRLSRSQPKQPCRFECVEREKCCGRELFQGGPLTSESRSIAKLAFRK